MTLTYIQQDIHRELSIFKAEQGHRSLGSAILALLQHWDKTHEEEKNDA